MGGGLIAIMRLFEPKTVQLSLAFGPIISPAETSRRGRRRLYCGISPGESHCRFVSYKKRNPPAYRERAGGVSFFCALRSTLFL